MSWVIRAIFENGILRPLETLDTAASREAQR
jgi:predicted DNA-binding antitoxin AbrB/MazE fold protein